MDKDLKNIIAFAFCIVGIFIAASSFSTKLETVEKKGLTVTSGLSLLLAGIWFYNRVEITAYQAKRL